ncbi:hypothetical protein BDV96DRAFT_593047 [Lophiotrema nucula]|uniref:Delta(24)-sterol reductase n=1 Tax=Lophiotrema nucula TaxID=690887 RepID=A0A6A5ZU55_9PLEO|nr:hypothetical protein BDV96DRAFT_593047 [Lophiotrema nucula]
MDTHRFVVREISKQVKAFHKEKKPFRIFHGSSYSTRAMHNPRAVVHTGDLRYILDINTDSNFAMVEPNVPMDELARATLKKGLLPPVVPGLRGLMVGGCFSGTATASSSFKYGYFDQAVAWVECVLPDGKITRASRTRNPDLFSGLVGTLGTAVPAAKYVELTCIPVTTPAESLDVLNSSAEELDNDFVEALLYGAEAPIYGVIVVASYLAKRSKSNPLVSFSGRKDPWFNLHVQKTSPSIECVPTMDYLFRHDRGSFNLGRFAFGRLPFNKWIRWLADSAMHSSDLVQTVKALRWTEHLIIQDAVIPQSSTFLMLEYLETKVKIYPIHICPVRHLRQPSTNPTLMRPNPTRTNLSTSLSIRGYTPSTIHDTIAFIATHRELEHLVRELGGVKWLYSKNYYTENEFWRIYDREEYDKLREKYGASYLANVFEKSRVLETGTMGRVDQAKGFWKWGFKRTGIVGMKLPPAELS